MADMSPSFQGMVFCATMWGEVTSANNNNGRVREVWGPSQTGVSALELGL